MGAQVLDKLFGHSEHRYRKAERGPGGTARLTTLPPLPPGGRGGEQGCRLYCYGRSAPSQPAIKYRRFEIVAIWGDICV